MNLTIKDLTIKEVGDGENNTVGTNTVPIEEKRGKKRKFLN